MLDTASLKKRPRPLAPKLDQEPAVDRVSKRLVDLECAHLRARLYGQHIVIEPQSRGKPRDRDAIARLTALGEDIYGLSFRRTEGGWEPMVLIDTLDEIVWEMVAAVTPDPPEVEEAAPSHSGVHAIAYESFDLGSFD
jgi:hypothetical protein